MIDAAADQAPDQAAPALPPELEQLEHLASAADAALDGAALPPGEAPPPAIDETAEVTGALMLVVSVGGMAIPPLAEVYDADACQAIAAQYMRCADAYGWTWHRNMNSPIVGLIAAAAMPGILQAGKFKAWAAEQRAKSAAQQRRVHGEQATKLTGVPVAPPMGPPMERPAAPPTYSPGHLGAASG